MTSPRQRVVNVALSHIGLQPPQREAQQINRVRRIGVFMPYDENDPDAKLRYPAFNGDPQR